MDFKNIIIGIMILGVVFGMLAVLLAVAVPNNNLFGGTTDSSGQPYHIVQCKGSLGQSTIPLSPIATSGIKIKTASCSIIDPTCKRSNTFSFINYFIGYRGTVNLKELDNTTIGTSQQLRAGGGQPDVNFQVTGCTADTHLKLYFSSLDGSQTVSKEVDVQ